MQKAIVNIEHWETWHEKQKQLIISKESDAHPEVEFLVPFRIERLAQQENQRLVWRWNMMHVASRENSDHKPNFYLRN